jgi:predicted acetyltransferase
MATTPADLDVRATMPHEHRTACDTMRAALLTEPISDADWERAAPSWEPHTSFTAWDGARCVGHAGAFHFHTVVPGGERVPTAGVTRVGVLPTHTRKGLLTRMMHQLLLASYAEGKAIASLRASEAVIYGRFGFGMAGGSHALSIDTRTVRPLRGAASGSCRVLQIDEVLDVVPALYARVATRAGAVDRPGFMWRRSLQHLLDRSKPEFVVVHSDADGTDDGFAHYRLAWGENSIGANHNTAEVIDLFGDGAAAELAVWAFLTDIDLIHTITTNSRPIDEPLWRAAGDMRAVNVTSRFDEQWVRILDAEAALRARSYRPAAAVTLSVIDPLLSDNTGTFRVSTDGVHRVSGQADLTVGIAALGAAYFGGTSWHELWAAGRIDEGSEEAARRADDLFTHWPATWCGTFF